MISCEPPLLLSALSSLLEQEKIKKLKRKKNKLK
jgi:hypothetical protein